MEELQKLLIVPYGIETCKSLQVRILPVSLLIVPYGIETTGIDRRRYSSILLIVPYGIETIRQRE